jgi:hypothetical protein
MQYFATLKTGKDYRLEGIVFKVGKEETIWKELYDYLTLKPETFSVRTEEVGDPKPDPTAPHPPVKTVNTMKAASKKKPTVVETPVTTEPVTPTETVTPTPDAVPVTTPTSEG